MKRVVEINNCDECPYLSHTGAFTKGGSKPCCDHSETVKNKGNDCFKRVIPYKDKYILQGRTIKVPKIIPDWCPLDTSEEYVEKNFNIDK